MAGLPVEERQGIAVARVSGRLTIGRELADLSEALEGVLDAGWRRIVFDLDAVPYVDSAGVGELVACRRTVRERGGVLVLARPRGRVRDLLELTRIETLVPVFADVHGAVAALAAPDATAAPDVTAGPDASPAPTNAEPEAGEPPRPSEG